ncbi:hypothetical protein AYJ54_36380 [Bradyrhizobium centrolobii]|uniref:Rad50/SbcC-type AAA domain-containing protein n=1 Tax=Bradyrhizobium centrolobii TaxID=1505087 RepID=A0A176Y7Z5_9BRAD|nr:hypothetical protein [Bradyrhizobium centrolobii]OAE96759.1 hypothetical protein AYJ54_36380 [Bradyrhizobium centrolobii]
MKFKRISLLSQDEKRAFTMEFHNEATVVKAGNGFGKSALLKSLYDTFGAEPHRIDQAWRSANVISAVDFEVNGRPQTIMKFAGIYTVFDEGGNKTLQTSSVTQGLAPFLADLLDFRLLMIDKREQVLIPPPAYAFAPFYMDQDRSWTSAWEPFRNMYLPRSAATLADYHSGLKPNEYYAAQAERDRLATVLREAELRRDGVVAAVEELRTVEPDTDVHFNIDDFQAETAELLAESTRLLDEQNSYRAKLSELIDARALWITQAEITRAALGETDEVFKSAFGHPIDVECPTCGEHYTNDIAARFKIAADAEALIAVLNHARQEQQKLDKRIEIARHDIEAIDIAASSVRAVLATRKNDLTFGAIVAAEGRNAATRVLRERVKEVDAEIGGLNSKIEEIAATMRGLLDRKRSRTIKDLFASHFVSFAQQLDVRIGDLPSNPMASTSHARGSEGPRGLAAYNYAFLYTTQQYGSMVFCPIVVDAPNQQGQDAQHLPAIISFLVKKRPKGAQLILGVEEAVGITENDADIVSVGVRKNQLLNEAEFEAVSTQLRPYIAQAL